MRPRGAVAALLAGLLAGALLAASATPADARRDHATTTARLGARLAPPVVTVGEPAALVSQLTPAQAGRPLSVQQMVDGAWTPVTDVTANGTGRNVLALDTTAAGAQVLRVVAPAWRSKPQVTSPAVTLKVYSEASCSPKVALVDPDATPAARCLAARLDRWQAAGLMGVGQELNMSTLPYDQPLTSLGGRRVSVVGFDLMELEKSGTYQFPFFDQAFADLVTQAQSGAVLAASWHAVNPHTGAPDSYNDRSWHRLAAVLEPTTPEAQAFWADYDEQLAVLRAFQDAGVAIVFRPLHEANGDWFWWGKASPSTFRAVWKQMQQRARAAEVHNIIWAYSFAASSRKGIAAPETMLPAKVDLAGIDSYWPATGSHRGQEPSMEGYAAVAKKVRRMAFTEIGPYADHGTWRPSVITSTARAQARPPVWAMLWVDDAAGRKQISSLGPDGAWGLSWLDSCPFGYCTV